MIKSYYEFLLESILYTSSELKEILQSIDDVIAKDFLQLIDQDIATPYNALNITGQNDTISFFPDNQFQRKISTGQSLENLLKDNSNKTSVGRLVQKILHDNQKNYHPNQVTEFTDKFKAAYTKYFTKETKDEPIRVVKGQQIRDWYLEEYYVEETKKGKGTLGKSCMRYSDCQDYFNIYVQNPDVCQMIINTTYDEQGDQKLVSRALLWKTIEAGWYLDRIYFTDASEKILMKEFAEKNFSVKHGYDFGSVPKLSIQLTSKTLDYQEYPYMDSFPYYYVLERKLYNYEPEVDNRSKLYEIQSTNGEPTLMDSVYCELDDTWYSSDEVTWSEYHFCNIPMEHAVYSYHVSSEIYEPMAFYSQALEDYLPEDDVREVFTDVDGRNYDFYPKGHQDIAAEAETGDFYLKSILVKVGDEYYLPSNLTEVYVIKEESKADYCRIFNKEKNIDIKKCLCSEVVRQAFGFQISDSEEKTSRKEYLKSTYETVIFDVLESRLPKLLKMTEYSEDVVDEMEDAKYYIHSIGLSPSLNYVHGLGGLDAFIQLYVELLNKSVGDTSCFSKTVRNEILFDPIKKHAEESRLSEIATKGLIQSTKATIHKIITKHLLEFLSGVEDASLPRIDPSKLRNIKQVIETDIENFDYLKEPEIAKNLILLIITRVIWESLIHIQGITGWDMRYSSISFFFKNPNKLKFLEYNP